MDDNYSAGLSAKNRSYIVWLVFFVLLIFGPVQPDGPLIRSLYLVAIPTAVWFVLRFAGSQTDIDACTNDQINRALTASIAGMLVVGAYLSYTAEYHSECTQSVSDGQGGSECVGDYVTRPGPDKGEALMLILFAGLAFWVAISRQSD